jgi:hypothetical protein
MLDCMIVGGATKLVGDCLRYLLARLQSCTYDQLTFLPENNLVFDVDVYCVGLTAANLTYNLITGYGNRQNMDNEKYGLVDVAMKFLEVGLWVGERRSVHYCCMSWYVRPTSTAASSTHTHTYILSVSEYRDKL